MNTLANSISKDPQLAAPLTMNALRALRDAEARELAVRFHGKEDLIDEVALSVSPEGWRLIENAADNHKWELCRAVEEFVAFCRSVAAIECDRAKQGIAT